MESKNINIGVDEKNRSQIAGLLNILLSDEYAANVKAKKFHWNLYGMHFRDLHLFFDEIYEASLKFIDDIAERVRALSFNTFGTLEEFKANTRLSENPGQIPNAEEMLAILLKDQESIIRFIRESIKKIEHDFNDSVTSNFLQELALKHEKTAWMIRSFIEKF